MKILGNRILNSDLRLTFETEDNTLSTAAEHYIKFLNAAVVTAPNENNTSLADFVILLQSLANTGEVKIAVEEITEE